MRVEVKDVFVIVRRRQPLALCFVPMTNGLVGQARSVNHPLLGELEVAEGPDTCERSGFGAVPGHALRCLLGNGPRSL